MNNYRGILQTARKVLEISMGVKPGESILITHIQEVAKTNS